MPFQKGRSGNPSGRPKKGDSLADLIRAEGNKLQRKEKMARRMWTLANGSTDLHIAIKAADWVAKHGYSPFADVGTDASVVPTKVIIELHPSA